MADSKTIDAPAEPPPSYESSTQPAPVAMGAPGAGTGRPPVRVPLPLDLPALNLVRGKRVILASASPRRKALLSQIGLSVDVVPSTFAEDLAKSASPYEYVLQTATQKAMKVYEREIDNEEKGEPALIIAADTIVVGHFGDVLEKPRSEREHVTMLKNLRDNGDHSVLTAVACMAPLEAAVDPGYALETHVEETKVRFDASVTDELLLAYVKTREGADKAGGYGIQGIGTILVERIEGTFDNVVGLPLRATLQLIEKVVTQDPNELVDIE